MPHLVDSEIAHALRSLVFRGTATDTDARSLDRLARLGMWRFAALGVLGRLWDLRLNLTAYHATYVALAEAIGCDLLTADRRLASAPGPRCPMVVVRG